MLDGPDKVREVRVELTPDFLEDFDLYYATKQSGDPDGIDRRSRRRRNLIGHVAERAFAQAVGCEHRIQIFGGSGDPGFDFLGGGFVKVDVKATTSKDPRIYLRPTDRDPGPVWWKVLFRVDLRNDFAICNPVGYLLSVDRSGCVAATNGIDSSPSFGLEQMKEARTVGFPEELLLIPHWEQVKP